MTDARETGHSPAGLTGPALRTFFRIAAAWELTEQEQLALLGMNDAASLEEIASDDTSHLPTEVIERLSYIFGIFRAINILIPRSDRADQWVRSANRAPMFKGKSALALMTSGEISELKRVRQYLDAELG